MTHPGFWALFLMKTVHKGRVIMTQGVMIRPPFGTVPDFARSHGFNNHAPI